MRKLKIKKRNHFCPWPFTWCLYKIARNDVIEGGRIPPLGRFLDFDSLKAHANGCNKYQQLPTLLRVVGQHCCVRLQLGLTLDRFQTIRNKCQQVPTSANIVVVPCKRTQQVTTLLGPTMLGVVGKTMLGSFALGLKVLFLALYVSQTECLPVRICWLFFRLSFNVIVDVYVYDT